MAILTYNQISQSAKPENASSCAGTAPTEHHCPICRRKISQDSTAATNFPRVFSLSTGATPNAIEPVPYCGWKTCREALERQERLNGQARHKTLRAIAYRLDKAKEGQVTTTP